MNHPKAARLQQMTESRPIASSESERIPPGQVVTDRFPILHEGEVPQYDMAKWDLHIFGEIEQELRLSYEDILAMPQTKVQVDIHCVTRWSKLDTTWQGVLFRDLLDRVKVKPEAKYVMIHADQNYETNVPLADLIGDDILLASYYDDKPMTPIHGWPLRLVVPHLYFWKSAKWIRKIEFMREDRHGFWEQNGFHNYGDPFKEQRFSGEALPIPEDEWKRKEFD